MSSSRCRNLKRFGLSGIESLMELLLSVAVFALDSTKEARHELVTLPYYRAFHNLAYDTLAPRLISDPS